MASRYEIEVKIASAKGLKNINWRHGPNRPYAVAWVDPKSKCSTKVDESGDTEAVWDETLRIPLPPGPIEDFTLHIDVVHAGSEEDIKPLIGSARLKLSEILDDAGIGERSSRTLTLKRPSGRPHGKIDVNVTIREIGYQAPGSYYAPPYGVPPSSASRDYPAPPYGVTPSSASRDYPTASPAYGYPYGAPPPVRDSYYSAAPPSGYPYSGYNAPPAPTAAYGQPSYGYGQGGPPGYAGEEKKKSKFGGMGTGLAVGAVAGALGGFALAEGIDHVEDKIEDDTAERVEDDLGYDGDDF